MSEDPIHLSGGDLNLYRYTSNSPVDHTDSSGLYSSSGNECEIFALNTYFQQLEIEGIGPCEQKLEEAMNECDNQKRDKKGEELTKSEKEARDKRRKDLGKEYSDAFRKENRKEIQRIIEKLIRGWKY